MSPQPSKIKKYDLQSVPFPTSSVKVSWQILCLVAVIFSAHHLCGFLVNQGNYTPFSVGQSVGEQSWDETFEYAAEVNAFSRRRYLGMECLFEYRNDRGIYPPLSVVLIGSAQKILNNLDLSWILIQIITSTFCWWFLFRIFRMVSASETQCMGYAWFVSVLSFGPRNALFLGRFSLVTPIDLLRFPNPCLTFALLLLAVVSTASALNRQTFRRYCVAGVTFGLLFYAYYFYWVAIYGMVLCLAVGFALSRRFREAAAILASGALGCVLGSPYLFVNHLARPNLTILLQRMGSFNRTPDLVGVLLILMSVYAIYQMLKGALPFRDRLIQKPEVFWLLLVLLALFGGAGVGMNFQLLTGYDAQHHGHFTNKVLQPTVGILLSIVVLLVVERYSETRRVEKFVTPIVILFLCVVSLRQICCGVMTAGDHLSSSSDMRLLTWGRDHLAPDIVVGSTDPQLVALIPSVMGTWPYLPTIYRTSATTEDILTRYLFLGHLSGGTLTTAFEELARFEQEEKRPWLSLIRLLLGGKLAESGRAQIKEVYSRLEKEGWTARARLNYVVLGKNIDWGEVRRVYPNAGIVYQNEKWNLIHVSDR